MRVVVTGGRKYDNQLYVWNSLDWFCNTVGHITMLIDGKAPGVDSFASDWADAREIDNLRVPARWTSLKLGAGHERNGRMVAYEPVYCLEFPGGTGTANMVKQCRQAGIAIVTFGI